MKYNDTQLLEMKHLLTQRTAEHLRQNASDLEEEVYHGSNGYADMPQDELIKEFERAFGENHFKPSQIRSRIKIVVTETICITHDADEDITQRMSDIYLHGRGDDGYMDKDDIGGSTTITVLDIIEEEKEQLTYSRQ